jgi:MoaA/NifB/PqqE/SkfB family radical SAM enzyme
VNIYTLLKLNKLITNYRLKSFGVYLLHTLGKRYLSIYFDPVLGCNLRCRMCYFSDEEVRKSMNGVLPKERINLISNALFHRALKLQIGCGAEPSLYKYNTEIIAAAKSKGIPYISMTSNGNLLTKEDLHAFFAAGLNEITLSMHGVYRETYEKLMTNASYDKFHAMLQAFTELKAQFPNVRLRINYTINQDNLMELSDLFELYQQYAIDIIQLRPIQKIGNSDYTNFSIDSLIENYNQTIGKVSDLCKQRDITCIAPTLKLLTKESTKNNMLFENTYCYVSPKYAWQDDFDPETESYESYSKRVGFGKLLWRDIFRKKSDYNSDTRNLNYTVS